MSPSARIPGLQLIGDWAGAGAASPGITGGRRTSHDGEVSYDGDELEAAAAGGGGGSPRMEVSPSTALMGGFGGGTVAARRRRDRLKRERAERAQRKEAAAAFAKGNEKLR